MLKALVTVAATLVIVAAANMLIVPAVHAQQGGADLGGPRINVTVENYVGQPLYAHCWSSEDDIGEHNLPDRHTFSWSFKINLFRTTKFVCNLKWNNMEKTIPIYEAKHDKGICADLCLRDIQRDGLLVYHEYEDTWEKRFEW